VFIAISQAALFRLTCISDWYTEHFYARAFTQGNGLPWNPAKHSSIVKCTEEHMYDNRTGEKMQEETLPAGRRQFTPMAGSQGPSCRILVEDDAAFGEFMCQAIAQETPHQAVRVSDSVEALKVVTEITPDLLILDYHLPNMNGIEVYDHLHATKELKHTPTIMMTAGVLEHDFGNRPIVGVSKPVPLNKLLDLIAELLE